MTHLVDSLREDLGAKALALLAHVGGQLRAHDACRWGVREGWHVCEGWHGVSCWGAVAQ